MEKQKTSSPWTSKTPKCYKRSTISVENHSSKKKKKKKEFQKGKQCGYESFIIPSSCEIEITLKYPALNSVKLNQDNFFEEISQIH